MIIPNSRYTYDADGNRTNKTMKTGGPAPTTVVRDVYQAGRIAYQTDGSGTTLATFAYDSQGVPANVQVGSDPATAPRYFYVYNMHGDAVALVDASGNTMATYSYDVFGGVTAAESLPGGWSNPYRYDGKDRVRYDSEPGLYWMSVRAYAPTLGRFLSRDPLNRQPLVFANQPYVYAGNNPFKNVDPSGQLPSGWIDGQHWGTSPLPTPKTVMVPTGGNLPTQPQHSCRDNPDDTNQVCAIWRGSWRDLMIDKRSIALSSPRIGGAASWILGIIAVAFSDFRATCRKVSKARMMRSRGACEPIRPTCESALSGWWPTVSPCEKPPGVLG